MNIQELVESIESNQNDYPFIPEILETLELIERCNDSQNIEQLKRLAGGLSRLVLEDFEFSNSCLGTELLKLTDSILGEN